MKGNQKNPNFIRFCIVLAAAVLCMSCPVSAWDFNVNPISTNNYMDISTSNGGGYYVGFRNAGGGLNALHITTSTSDPYGQVTSVSSDSGTFYLADTGGRGYFDRAVLMVAIKVPDGGEEISENLTVHLRASGYQWVSEGIKDKPPNEENITYVADSINGKYGLSSVKYGPQSWKPAGEEGHSIMSGQSASDEFYIFFVDTGVGILGKNSGITGLTDNGMARIDYTIEDYNGETVVFNVYGYALWADAVKDGIAWTNKIDGTVTDKNARTGASGYSVLLGSSGGSGEFGGSTAIDYGDSGAAAGPNTWAPAVGNLNITSSPAGARVYLDSVDTGRVTNASFVDIPEGEYVIRLELPGYEPLERTGIRVQSGHVTTRHFNMTLAKGSCTVLSDVRGARIVIDGNETLCYANWTFDDIEVGNHTISLEKDGYDPVSREVVIDDTNAAVVFLAMSGSGSGEVDVGGEPAAGNSHPSGGTEPNKETRTESAGFLDLLFSMIAGLLGGADVVSPAAAEASGDENGSTGAIVPVPTDVPEPIAESGGDAPGPDAVRAARIGSVHVASYPSGSSILVDGRDTGYTTPRLIYGLSAGTHSITVKLPKTGSASQTVLVPAGGSTVVDLNLMEADSPTVPVHVTSKEFRGGNFSLNGEPPSISLPSQVTVELSGGYLTYTDGDHYYSRTLTAPGSGQSVVLEKTDAFGTINVTSVPGGADIYIDGVGTGCKTPCTFDNVGYGYHKLMITKPGYLPVKREVRLIDTGDEIDMVQNFVLEEIATGRLAVTSNPPGCMVYLRGVYTGQTTPCTFEDVPIGTYDVGVAFNRTHFGDREVTVLPWNVHGDTAVDVRLEERS
ncbi:PEGA domain protein [anaerobic digester metagenome]